MRRPVSSWPNRAISSARDPRSELPGRRGVGTHDAHVRVVDRRPGHPDPDGSGRPRPGVPAASGWAVPRICGVALIRSAGERSSRAVRGPVDGRDFEVLGLPLGQPGQLAVAPADRSVAQARTSSARPDDPHLMRVRVRGPVHHDFRGADLGLQLRDRGEQGDGYRRGTRTRPLRHRPRRRRTAPAGRPGHGCRCRPRPGRGTRACRHRGPSAAAARCGVTT